MAAQVCGAQVSGAGVSAQIRVAAQARGGRHAEGSDTQPDGGCVAQRLLVL